MPAYKATAIIPWKDRPELERSLHHNSPIFKQLSINIVVVNCGGDQEKLLDIISGSNILADLIHLPLAVFNRSLALNIGAFYSPSDLLFFIDADILAHYESLVNAIACFNSASSCMITIKQLLESAPESTSSYFDNGYLREVISTQITQFLWSNGQTTSVPNWRSSLRNGSQGGQGQLLVKKLDFLRIGGYNSELVGWGFEDIDILIRLQHVLNLRHEQIGKAMHLSHGDESRDVYYGSKHVTNQRNRLLAFAKYGEGQFDGSMLGDSQRWSGVMEIYRVIGDTIVQLKQT